MILHLVDIGSRVISHLLCLSRSRDTKKICVDF